MIKEIFGLPGSGKSYVVKKITGSHNTVAMTDNKIKSVFIRILKRIILYIPSSLFLKIKIHRCLKSEKQKPIYIDKPLNYFVDKIIILASSYKYLKDKDIFMDEGVIHRIVSLAVNFGLKQKTFAMLINIFEKYLKNVQLIYLDVSAELCFHGIKERNRHECEMDEFDDEKLKHYLMEYKKYFDYVNQTCKCVRINRENYNSLEDVAS